MMGATDERAGVAAETEVAVACRTRFDDLPSEMTVRAFGVDYGHLRSPEGGDLYVTRYGWPFLPHLLPSNWYADKRYARAGNRLPGSGCVYHVVSQPVHGKSIEIVVKFSRVAQDVPLEVATTFPDDVSPEVIANARFNSPMEEFGLVMELRRGEQAPNRTRVLTQRPLAIYAPPEEFELWELGRCPTRFHAHWHLLARDQENSVKAIELDIKRVYVLLYGWIKGEDADQAFRAGEIGEAELRQLTRMAIDDLQSNGFRVLDNKPNHFILRRRRRDSLPMRRRGSGRLIYGLVDFELLQRTPEYQRRFKAAQRERYWHLQNQRWQPAVASAPRSPLKHCAILGVDYIFGTTPDGGKLWVVGSDPELFDYFLPDRWRRTPREKLSLTNEVYHTRTRDNIHVVYRRSRVGAQPRVDPLGEGKRLREHGYNSPFEEVAGAETLREAGIFTTYPRAIYRTGHQSSNSAHLRDERRFATHASLTTPEHPSEPILRRDYDYYTIWGYFRGIDPHQRQAAREACAVLDLEQACGQGLIDEADYHHALRRARDRLRELGINTEGLEDYELVMSVRDGETICRDLDGELDLRLCIDAQSTYEYGLLSEQAYAQLIQQLDARLRLAGWESLNLAAHHLLLSMTPRGILGCEHDGELHVVLCNFEFARGPHALPQ